jgi:PPOX class probable F420-dependent enzyme
MAIDLSTDFGKRVANRLRDEQILWLTTTGADGTPQPNPVWFLWTGQEVLVFSEPTAVKLRHLARNPHVALNFNTDAHGGSVAVITGRAEVASEPVTDGERDAFAAKYAEGIKSIGLTPEAMLEQYSVRLRVTPERLRGF